MNTPSLSQRSIAMLGKQLGFVGCGCALAGLLAAPAGAQVTVGPAVKIDNTRGPQPCNETTVSVAKSNPLEVVAGWNDYREGTPRTGVGLSLDGGATWTDFLLRPPPGFQANVEGDPMTAYDDRTGTLWAGGISFAGNGGIFTARKNPGSGTFQPVVMANVGGGIDKGWMAAGPDPFDPLNKTRVYLSYNFGTQFSATMGDSWAPVVSHGPGLGFLPRVGPQGQVYVAYWDTNTEMLLVRSFDGGVTWSAPILAATRMDVWGLDGSRFPGNFRVASLAALAVHPQTGVLYYAYPDTTAVVANGSDVDIYLTTSSDQGSNWTTPVVINTDPAIPGDQFFPFLDFDDQGRLQAIWYDTSRIAQNDNAPQALIDTVHAWSSNGLVWNQTFITPQPFTSANDGFGGGFVGDYLGVASAGNRTLPVYMSTSPGNADVFTNAVQHGPATTYCFGIGCPCLNQDPDAGCGNAGLDGSPATGALLRATGSASAAADDLVLTLAGLQPNSIGLIYVGTSNLVNTPFGDGRQCVGGTVFRYPAKSATALGVLTYGPGEVATIANTTFGPAGAVVPGATWHYQGWYRDIGGPCGSGFNFTNAATVVWQ